MRIEKLADRPRAPWRMAVALVSVTAGATFALWAGREIGPRKTTHCRCAGDREPDRPTYVHLKVAVEDAASDTADEALGDFESSMFSYQPADDDPDQSTLVALDVQPLFVGLPDDVHDARTRWLRILAPSRDEAERWVDALNSHTTWGYEQAFIAPESTLPDLVDVGDNTPHYVDRGVVVPPDVADAGRIFDRDLHLIDADAALRGPTDDDSCPLNTPSYESYQGYLGPAPHGIDAPFMWRRQIRGQGVWFADVEGGWNAKHEDLPGDRISHAGGRPINDPSWRAHGTAVLGEVVGRDNGKGVVGIAPDVEQVFTSSLGGTSVANAIDTAARKLRPGDVLLIELQSTGPRGRYLPVEFWDDVFDAIQAATRRGVVIIEAAGNGAEDLDHKDYKRKLDRTKRDSGAIMIGAGGPPRDGFRDREKLDFSNYGGRVDVQGWGRMVATLDYGDLQSCDVMNLGGLQLDRYTDRHYTNLFSGTSSASPIVAGAAVLLESYAKARTGKPIPPLALRDLLRKTGTPQAGDTTKQIGPRPDLKRAMGAFSQDEDSQDEPARAKCDPVTPACGPM